MLLIETTVFCLLAVSSLWTGISAVVPLPEESMNVVSVMCLCFEHGGQSSVLHNLIEKQEKRDRANLNDI